MPIGEARYVVFDTELTGLQPKKDSIVSIGAVKMLGGKILLGDIFYRIVEPRTKLTGKSVVIHGITPSEVTECPGIATLLPEFLDFCGNSVMVGHFVTIDITFINMEMKRLYGLPLQNPSIDTLKLYTWIRQKEEQVCAYHGGLSDDTNLFSLAQKYAIPISKSHNALDDAFVTGQLFQRFISILPKFGIKTVGDLLNIGRQ
jgi:DNA polymerase-3 subunit epsilon